VVIVLPSVGLWSLFLLLAGRPLEHVVRAHRARD
jgi:hypothetical protein